MAKYNVSKKEAKRLGIERVLVGGSKSSSKSSKIKIPKVDTSQLKALQNQYQEVLKPTQEETDTNTQLGNVITSKELGIAKAEQEPMAQQFITGQSAALEKSAALKAMPLQTKLANLQARRSAAADVLKSQLGFESENVNRQTQLAESATNRAMQAEQNNLAQQFQEKQFNESVRQFNSEQARLKSNTGSSNSFEKVIANITADVLGGRMSREGAKDILKRQFPGIDENIIYTYIPDNYDKKSTGRKL